MGTRKTKKSLPTKKQVKKHRHKWTYDHEDCSRCGGGLVRWCDCGEAGEVNFKPTTPAKKKRVGK